MDRKRNFSHKRVAILKALQATAAHPSADWIYAQLKPQYPGLSLGTVYRNLHTLCEAGQAISLGPINGHERFDGRLAPHAHLVCSRCGAVADMSGGLPDQASLAALSHQNGCQVQSAHVVFHGLCPQCLEGETTQGKKDPST